MLVSHSQDSKHSTVLSHHAAKAQQALDTENSCSFAINTTVHLAIIICK
jgi:hypothetical protein